MAYDIKTITAFKGLSQTLALTAGDPAFSLDCVNVIPSIAGLAKMRIPTELSTANSNNWAIGPDQFGMFESSTQKEVLVFFGQDIWSYSLDDFTPTLIGTNSDFRGLVPWSVVQCNNFSFIQNGLASPLKYGGGLQFEFWGIQKGNVPTLGSPTGTGITLAIGRKYRVSYENGVTFSVGTASDPSDSTGAITNQTQPVDIPATTGVDLQITEARLYATLDGGNDYFLHSVVPGPFPVTVDDATPDADLDQSERAPLINDEPPKALYMCLWGGRIFMFNLPTENPKWVAYTGYNRIFVGRPEETCPPGNRIKLETGADDIAGGGVIPSGVVVFDRSNKMFMFRGQPEDITVDAPVEFTLYLKSLPWQIGCAGHFTIQSTPRGLVWLSSSLDVFVFNGESEPLSIDEGVEPILRTINQSQVANSRSAYWQYKGRNWYVLGVPTGSSADLTKLLIFDLEESAEKNVGTFPLDVGKFQSLGVVEMTDGSQKLVIGQDGLLKELNVTPTTINGIEQNIVSTSGTLGAYWRSGCFGNESPQANKFFRWCRIVADQPGIRVKRYLYQDIVTQPEPIEFVDTFLGGKLSTNRKGRRLSYELRFRDEDTPQNILEVTDASIPVSVR